MRLMRLDLRAFGPFTDRVVDFSGGDAGLHVVYGPNEAGKSSAMRALWSLLFGIPVRTGDDFVHKMRNLRIGGALRHSDGTQIEFSRLKRNKDSLVDPGDRPLPETALVRFLGGVDLKAFQTLFAIDHERLVAGGREILDGKGEVGESLFAAGLGVAGLRKVMRELEVEAEKLFAPRAQNPVINAAVARYERLIAASRDAALAGGDWRALEASKAAHASELEGIRAQIRRLGAERERLRRIQACKPLIGRRAGTIARLEELGSVVRLRPGFGEERREALGAMLRATGDGERAGKERADLQARIASLDVPQAVLDLDEDVQALHRRLGAYLKSAEDLPRREAEAASAGRRAEALLRSLRPDLELDRVEEISLTRAQFGRLRTLGAEWTGLLAGRDGARIAQADLETEREAARASVAALPSNRDGLELSRILARARRLGDAEGAVRKGRRNRALLEERCRLDLAALGRWTGDLEGLLAAPLPAAETVDRFDGELASVQADRDAIEDRLRALRSEAEDLREKGRALQMAGDVPTEADLAALRARREAGWHLVRRSWLEGLDSSVPEVADWAGTGPLAESYEAAVARADETADRLRREAARVEALAATVARAERLDGQARRLEEERGAILRRREAVEAEWRAAWVPAGFEPGRPREMRAWLGGRDRLAAAAALVANARDEADAQAEAVDDARRELAGGLERLGEPAGREDETLEERTERAQGVADAIAAAASRRADLEKRVADIERRLPSKRALADQAADRLATWQAEWALALAPLGMPVQTTPDEAEAVVATLTDLLEQARAARLGSERAGKIRQDMERFEADVDAFARRAAADLSGKPAAEAVSVLTRRLDKARADQATRNQLVERAGTLDAEIHEAGRRRAQAQDALGALCVEAGGVAPQDLEACEQRSRAASDAEAERAEVEARLAEAGGGLPLDEVIRQADAVDGDSLPGQIAEIAAALEDLEHRRDGVQKSLGGLEEKMAALLHGRPAAEDAQEASGVLTQVREGVERYLPLKLASLVLRREVERYRALNQDPVLRQANEVFQRLTCGAFQGIRTDCDDQDRPVLVGARRGGEAVAVGGMSDGTRDQLFLALRLASLARYLEMNEPMPLVVDDILVNFDDARAAATLEVLGHLSRSTQVILFTHHRRVCELAEAMVPAGTLFLQDLAR